jgi:hypothetical protein
VCVCVCVCVCVSTCQALREAKADAARQLQAAQASAVRAEAAEAEAEAARQEGDELREEVEAARAELEAERRRWATEQAEALAAERGLAVSPYLAWFIGSPCLRHCVHGASIGEAARAGDARAHPRLRCDAMRRDAMRLPWLRRP